MFSDHDGTSLSITAVSVPSIACSMLAVRQQKWLCRQVVDVSAARRGHHVTRCVEQLDLEFWQPASGGPRCIPACVREATCEPASMNQSVHCHSCQCSDTFNDLSITFPRPFHDFFRTRHPPDISLATSKNFACAVKKLWQHLLAATTSALILRLPTTGLKSSTTLGWENKHSKSHNFPTGRGTSTRYNTPHTAS